MLPIGICCSPEPGQSVVRNSERERAWERGDRVPEVTHFVTPGIFEVYIYGHGVFATVLRYPKGSLRNSHASVRNSHATKWNLLFS